MILIQGPATIYYGPSFCADPNATASSGSTTAWATGVAALSNFLGRTENGIQYSIQNGLDPVYVDDNGGTEGDPVEYIIKNTTASLQAVVVDFGTTGNNATDWQTVTSRLENGYYQTAASAGLVNPAVGTPIFGNNYGFGLKVVGSGGIGVVIPRCTLIESPRQFNTSSSHKKLSLRFTAYPIYQRAISSVGANTMSFNKLWVKGTYTATAEPCYDAIGGYEDAATSNAGPNA